MTIDKTSWGWNRKSTLQSYKTTKDLIDELVMTVSRNGNMLINVGPASDGTISPIFMDRLLGLGDWLKVNGRAIYKSRPWGVCDRESDKVYYTRDNELLYVHLTQWPVDNQVMLNCPQVSNSTKAFVLGMESSTAKNVMVQDRVHNDGAHWLRIKSKTDGRGAMIQLPDLNPATMPCEHVWVVAMTDIKNLHVVDAID